MKKNRYVVIGGCGQFGLHIAERMSRSGSSVVLIDRDPRTFAALSSEFSGFTMEGDATELAVLKKAKTEQADLFLASTESDNINILIAEVARYYFGVLFVTARIFDPKLAEFYKETEIRTICPTLISAEELFSVDLSPVEA